MQSPFALALGAIAATGCIAAAVCLATGVRLWELLAFAVYEAVFVVAPGVLVLRALLPRPGSPAAQVAVGWPLGFALQLAMYIATSAIGVRWLFFLYPLIVCAAAAPRALRRSQSVAQGGVPRAAVWATVAAVGTGLALLGLGTFATNALPRSVSSVVLYVDSVFDIALAAEALHHWPMQDPNVSGEALRYHVLAFVDAAAVHQVTGIELDVIILRLQPVLIVALIGFQLAWLTLRAAPRALWAAPAAVAIMLLANELDLHPARDYPFGGSFFFSLPLSPTFAYGLPFFIAATGILLELLSGSERWARGMWLVLAALFAAGMGAKASTLPVLIVALAVVVAARAVIDRTVDRRALGALGLALATFVVMYVALFRGGQSGTTLSPLNWVNFTSVATARDRPLVALAAALVATCALLAPWFGGALLVGRVRGREQTAALWLGAVVVGAVVPFMLLAAPAFGQAYFFQYGTPAAAVLSGWGLVHLRPTLLQGNRRLVVPAATLIIAAIVAGLLRAGIDGPVAPYALAIGAIGLVALYIDRRARSALAWAVALLVALTVLDVPLDIVPSWARAEVSADPHHQVDTRTGPRGVNTDLLAGLRWLRGHSEPDDVLAVDIQSLQAGTLDARYFAYAAFAERRTFLGGWAYATVTSAASGDVSGLFQDRRRINARAFAGDRAALELLRRRYGVRYLLVDLSHGPPHAVLDRVLRRVYANPALRIYRV